MSKNKFVWSVVTRLDYESGNSTSWVDLYTSKKKAKARLVWLQDLYVNDLDQCTTIIYEPDERLLLGVNNFEDGQVSARAYRIQKEIVN